MASPHRLFATTVFAAPLLRRGGIAFARRLEQSSRAIAAADRAGRAWCRANGYKGYTSYASLNDLAWRDPDFADLVGHLDRHVAGFARTLDFDLQGKRLALDSLWVNILPPGGTHSAHLHPNSAISGTYYVALPAGASGIKFEDPRLAMMMAAPPRRTRAGLQNKTFVTLSPKAGDVLLWESFLRHEVPATGGKAERISISFNYAWGS